MCPRRGRAADDESPPEELAVGLPRLVPHRDRDVVHEGYTVLLTARDAQISGAEQGLFDFDTRILSCYRLTLDGKEPSFLDAAGDGNHWHAHLRVPRPGGTPEGPLLPQDTFEVEVERQVGCGMVERLTLRNHSMTPATTELALELDADFSDLLALGSAKRPDGKVEQTWDKEHHALTFHYRASKDDRTVERALRVTVAAADSPPRREDRTLRFHLELPPHGEWHATLGFASLVDGTWRDPLGADRTTMAERARQRDEWLRLRTQVRSSNALAAGAFERGAKDLIGLRNWEYDAAPDAWVPNGGVPTYTGLFGRDSLMAGWQAALLGPEMMRGALAVLSARQATEDSAWRDEHPNKLLHEARRGPLSDLDLVPQRAYFGEQTAPAMFVVTLSEYWHWTGDTAALEHYRETALRTFEWAARYGDGDGDGLLEYFRRSPKGLKNQAWKDSDEAVRYADGSIVPDPISTIEENAYHFIALQRMAEILLVLGDEAGSEHFLAEARQLYERVNDRFWLEDEQYYAPALDPDKRPVRSITSNPGHALAAGIIAPERARAVADRLLADDLFSGWGIRTLSAKHPSYNPFAYHLGTVWPVETATIALGCKRYGLEDHAERLLTALFDATPHFAELRLPEALAGHPRQLGTAPSVYPKANAPQAWSASAIVQFIQLQLGILAFEAAHVLGLVRPRLPEWLPDVTLHGIRIGSATVSLRFRRRDDGSAEHQVIERNGEIWVIEVPPPVDLAAQRENPRDHLVRWAVEHAHGTVAEAIRIAMGGKL